MPQPKPKRTTRSESVTDAAIKLLQDRRKIGLKTYGSELLTFNGRDALKDFRDEIADGYVYMTQKVMELEVYEEKLRQFEATLKKLHKQIVNRVSKKPKRQR